MLRAERTVDILLKAFFRGKLIHGGVCDCAVGNLVGNQREWGFVILRGWSKQPEAGRYRQIGLEQIRDTRYSPYEVRRIEVAFESRKHKVKLNCVSDRDGFLGLSNVFDLLLEIDKDYFQSRPAFRITCSESNENEVEVLEPA